MYKSMLFLTCATLVCTSMAYAADKKPVRTTPPTIANDNAFFFKPYIGADYQFSKYGNDDIGAGVKSDDIIDTSLQGGNVHVGARVHKNLGFEAGYFQTQAGRNDASDVFFLDASNTPVAIGETKTDVKGVTLDALGYYPLSKEVELIGTVGISYATATTKFSNPLLDKTDDSEWKPRVGAGAQYWLTDNLNARTLVRYQAANFDDSVDDAVVATAGVNFQF